LNYVDCLPVNPLSFFSKGKEVKTEKQSSEDVIRLPSTDFGERGTYVNATAKIFRKLIPCSRHILIVL
jgi:hypothetical protein